MSKPSDSPASLEEPLRSLVDRLLDAQTSLREKGEQFEDPTLKLHFFDESLLRAQFRGDLETVLHHEGVKDVDAGGTVASALHRAWGELKAKLGGEDRSLIDAAENDQLADVEAYARALQGDLPLPVRQTLVSQANHIQFFLEYLRAARKISGAIAGRD